MRKKSYLHEHGPAVDEKGLLWNDVDSQSVHLGIYRASQLISTLRITPVFDSALFKQVLLHEHCYQFPLPGLILARASTDPDHTGKGYHTLLRYVAFKWALQNQYGFIYGTIKKSAIRCSFLEKLGYEFIKNPVGWSGFFKSLGEEIIILKLDLLRNQCRVFELLEYKLNKYTSTGQLSIFLRSGKLMFL